MTVLSVYEVSSVFFQRSTDAGYIDFCRQSFKFSRGQHATNKAVEHLDAGLCCYFFNDPLLRRADQNFAKVNSGNAQYSLGGLGTTGQCRAGALETPRRRSPSPEDGQRRVLVRCYAMLCVGSRTGSSFRYYSA